MLADYNYLRAAQSSGTERAKFIQQAGNEYIAAWELDAEAILKYYVVDPVAAQVYPVDPKTHQRYNRANIAQADPRLWPGTSKKWSKPKLQNSSRSTRAIRQLHGLPITMTPSTM